ncbi:MAG: hypothetical protein QOK10_2117 [Pseudonocardiales bacterium]|jgi:predicted dehydrogenase|nr:hypothetical protein [Pseudonocardiales bacterium]
MSEQLGLRAAILGYGFAGRIFHAPFLSAAGFEVAAISTSDPQRVQQAGADYPEAEVVAHPAQLIGREDIDLIVVATPNATHAPLSIAALEAGHDVVVDKPFAPSVAEAQQIIDTAAATGAVLSVFQSRRFDSDFRTVRKLVDSGELGQVRRFESRYERWRPDLTGNWRESADPQQAGGLLYDLGAHLIDQFISLFGTPRRVYAELDARRSGAVVDDDVFLALQTDAVRGHLWLSSVAPHAGPRFRVLGHRAAFVKFGMDPQEEALLAGARPPAADWGIEPAATYGQLGTADQWRPVVSEAGDYADFYREFAAAMRGDAEVPVNPADSLAGLRVIEAAQRSASSGTIQPI